jgi:Xaa-Pro aminopeptidase
VRTRNRDVDYPFRQDSDFYYLTGFNEADALAVFILSHRSERNHPRQNLVSRLPALHAHLPIKPFSHQIPDRIKYIHPVYAPV